MKFLKTGKNQGKEKDFFSGVALLTLSGFAVKICGMLFKIPLVRVIGQEGMGYFGTAYVIYTFFFVLSTSGLPVGLSLLVARSESGIEQRRFLNAALLFFGGAGVLFGAWMALFPEGAASIAGNPEAKASVAVMGPTLACVSICGALRGYFQGRRDMLPTAVSQMIEALGKTALGIALSYCAVARGASPQEASAAALLGVCIGSVLSLAYLLVRLWLSERGTLFFKGSTPSPDHFKRLLTVVLPVTASSAVLSVSSLVDLSVVMRRLRFFGYSAAEANRLFGAYSSLATPLFNLPAVFIAPVASALVPHLAQAYKRNDSATAKNYIQTTLRAGMILSLPCACGLFVLARPILTVLFGESAADAAYPMLRALAFSIVPVALQTLTGAALQGQGRKVLPVFSILIGSLLKLAVSYFLIGKYGMIGAPVGTFVCYFVSSFIQFAALKRRTEGVFPVFRSVVSPTLSALACGATAAFVYARCARFSGALHGLLPLAFAIFSGAAVFLALLLLTGGIDRGILSIIPGADRLSGLLFRLFPGLTKMKKRNESGGVPSEK